MCIEFPVQRTSFEDSRPDQKGIIFGCLVRYWGGELCWADNYSRPTILLYEKKMSYFIVA